MAIEKGIVILYCADIHGDTKALEMLKYSVRKFSPDIIFCNGDIAGPVLSDEEKKALAEFGRYRAALDKGERKIMDTGLESRAKAIIQSNHKRRGEMYKNMRGVLDAISDEAKCPYFVVPGEHDTLKQKGGVLSDKLLDYKSMTRLASNTTFAGVGGGRPIEGQETESRPCFFEEGDADAFECPNELKEKLTAPSGVILEPYRFFSDTDPDIAVVHMPPFFDEQDSEQTSKGLAVYINDSVPNLVLCAHTHNYGIRQWDSETNRSTVVVNPGNLGAVYGSEGNTFAMVRLDKLNYVMMASIFRQYPSKEGTELQVLEELVR